MVMSIVDLVFPVTGTTVPTAHGYLFYSAAARLIPDFHDPSFPVAVGALAVHSLGNGLLKVSDRSRIFCRIDATQIPRLIVLAGQELDIGGHRIRLGAPQVRQLHPARELFARMVTIKGFEEPDGFFQSARRQLDALGIGGELHLPVHQHGERQGKPRRQVLRIKEQIIVGFSTRVANLKAAESLLLQAQGIGGRRRMGCGVFLPVSGQRSDHES